MTGKVRYLIFCLLLLSISATVIPFNILHDHKESHCDKTNELLENDPCHISVYHANEFQKPHCDHKNHINKEFDYCDFCKIISSQRYFFVLNKFQRVALIFFSKDILAFEPNPLSSFFFNVIFSRGPPA